MKKYILLIVVVFIGLVAETTQVKAQVIFAAEPTTISKPDHFDSNEQRATNINTDALPPICDRTCTTTGWIPTGDTKCYFSFACIFILADGYFVEQEKYTTCVYTCDDRTRYEKTYYNLRWVRRGCCSGGVKSREKPCKK